MSSCDASPSPPLVESLDGDSSSPSFNADDQLPRPEGEPKDGPEEEFILHVPLRVPKRLLEQNGYLESLHMTADADTNKRQRSLHYSETLPIQDFAHVFAYTNIPYARVPEVYRLALKWEQKEMCRHLERQIEDQPGVGRYDDDAHRIIALHAVSLMNPLKRDSYMKIINEYRLDQVLDAVDALKQTGETHSACIDLQRIVYQRYDVFLNQKRKYAAPTDLALPDNICLSALPMSEQILVHAWMNHVRRVTQSMAAETFADTGDLLKKLERSWKTMSYARQCELSGLCGGRSTVVPDPRLDSLLVEYTTTDDARKQWAARLHAKSYGVLDMQLFPWDTAVLFGGILEACSYNTESEGEHVDAGVSDIDILITSPLDVHSCNDSKTVDLYTLLWHTHVRAVINYFKDRAEELDLVGYLTEQEHSVVISFEGVRRHFQISGVSITAPRIAQHLIQFDFAHNQAIYDGKNVRVMPYTGDVWKSRELLPRRTQKDISVPRLYKALLKGYTIPEEGRVNDEDSRKRLAEYLQWMVEKGALLRHKDYFPTAGASHDENRMRLLQTLRGSRSCLLNEVSEADYKRLSIGNYATPHLVGRPITDAAEEAFWKVSRQLPYG